LDFFGLFGQLTSAWFGTERWFWRISRRCFWTLNTKFLLVTLHYNSIIFSFAVSGYTSAKTKIFEKFIDWVSFMLCTIFIRKCCLLKARLAIQRCCCVFISHLAVFDNIWHFYGWRGLFHSWKLGSPGCYYCEIYYLHRCARSELLSLREQEVSCCLWERERERERFIVSYDCEFKVALFHEYILLWLCNFVIMQ